MSWWAPWPADWRSARADQRTSLRWVFMTRRVRVLLSIATLLAPVGALLYFAHSWLPQLPAALPSHWGSGGLSDATTSTPGFLQACLSVAGVGALIAFAGYFIRGPGIVASRWVIAVGGSLSAVPVAVWMSAAGVALGQPDGLNLPLGFGALLTMAAVVYGALPAILRPVRKAADANDSRRGSSHSRF